MASARAATAAAVAGLVAVAAWSSPAPSGAGRLVAGSGQAPPALASPLAWQVQATDAGAISTTATATIAVVDTGADLSIPSFAGQSPETYDVRTQTTTVTDANGHGTFVAAIAASSGAPLLIVRAADASGSMSAKDEAAAIRYAVARGARIVNLSIAGPSTSTVERAAIRYAASHGVLLVAAAGNDYRRGNPVEYPAALLQPVGSNGRGGIGLVVGASKRDGTRADFSSTGSWISLAAPGDNVLGAVSRRAPSGLASGTSFAAPQVAAAASLVWSANPALTARQVADILEQTASGHGTWTPELGYGVIDVAAALARARVASGA